MGRRIAKSRRHKKLKFVDPCYSGPPVRPKNRKILPNEPPMEEDYQEMPKSVQQFVDAKNMANQDKSKKRKKKKMTAKDDFIIVKKDKIEERQPGMMKPVKALPDQVVQGKNETQWQFVGRLQKMADMAIAEAKIEEKYDINIVNIDECGNAEYVSSGPKQSGPRKKEKRKIYKQKEKEKKRRKVENRETEYVKDNVKFGEVAMEPPTLSFKPRNAPETKAGKRNLALTALLQKNNGLEDNANGETQKKKVLTPSQKLMLEAERSRVVELYRSMKKKK